MYLQFPLINPYDHQLRILRAVKDGKNVLAIIHRRAGKDICCLSAWVLRALQRVGTHVYLFPLYSQARAVIWNGMDFDGKPFISNIPEQLIESKNQARMEIQLINGSRLVLAGSNNVDSLMGTNPVTIIYSEFALHHPLARQYLNPILIQNGGLEIIQSTPRGKNHLFELYEAVRENPKYHIEHLSIEQTHNHEGLPLISSEQVKDAKKMGMSDEMIRQELYCFVPESEVLTSLGLKAIKDIKAGDIVLSHAGRWRNVNDVISHDVNEDVVIIKSAGSFEPIVCTLNHPIRVYSKSSSSHSWVPAGEIKKGDYLLFPKLSNSIKFNLSSVHVVKLLAWYIAEGSTAKSSASFTLNISEVDYAREIKDCLDSIGIGYAERLSEHGSTRNIIVSSSSLSDFLVHSCGSLSHNKKIPFNLIQGHEEVFFNSLIKGDGCQFQTPNSGSVTYQYTTTSKSLAYQVQLLGNSIGLRMTISKCTSYPDSLILGRAIKSTQPKYDIRGTKPNTYEQKQRTPLRKTKFGIASLVRSVERQAYSGPVFNLNVAYDSSYVVAGRMVHNCDFDVGNLGAYFTREMSDMEREGRITTFLPNPNLPLHSVWDLGGTDATAAWLFQVDGQFVNLLAVLHDTGYGLKHYLELAETMRKQFNCQWGNHFMPHDVKQGHQGWESTESRLMIARRHGWHFQVTPRVNFEDGIEAMRYVFPKLRVNKVNCQIGIRAMREYQREYDEVKACYKPKPLDNWATHILDSLRYLSINYRRLYDIPQSSRKYEYRG